MSCNKVHSEPSPGSRGKNGGMWCGTPCRIRLQLDILPISVPSAARVLCVSLLSTSHSILSVCLGYKQLVAFAFSFLYTTATYSQHVSAGFRLSVALVGVQAIRRLGEKKGTVAHL